MIIYKYKFNSRIKYMYRLLKAHREFKFPLDADNILYICVLNMGEDVYDITNNHSYLLKMILDIPVTQEEAQKALYTYRVPMFPELFEYLINISPLFDSFKAGGVVACAPYSKINSNIRDRIDFIRNKLRELGK